MSDIEKRKRVYPGYQPLANVLQAALDQAQAGKGNQRHANGKPFLEQPIITHVLSLLPTSQDIPPGRVNGVTMFFQGKNLNHHFLFPVPTYVACLALVIGTVIVVQDSHFGLPKIT